MQPLLIAERKLKRIFKVLKGSYYALLRKGTPWERDFWDEEFYTGEISDQYTIGQKKTLFSSRHHYASVEMLIFRQLVNYEIDRIGDVLDIGSGAGHWLDLYREIGAGSCTGVEVSAKCAAHLEKKYQDDVRMSIHHGKILEFLEENAARKYDLVNAIGVLFHIVDDDELIKVLNAIYACMNDGASFMIGGNFGIWPFSYNPQVKNGKILNKRLRSLWWWRRQLRKAGFKKVILHRNTAYAFINDTTPENSLLVARK